MRKVYVYVTSSYTEDGALLPLSFRWEDGTHYDIDKVYDFRKAASQKVGGQGIRFRCRVMNKEVYLFLEDNKWFMEGK
ncbi:MAG: hypothetical protein K0R50_4358 [Eubacterium sp.]|jgi:hypothetical protein|nr:hypothetical protein [Eubacterium sp.]